MKRSEIVPGGIYSNGKSGRYFSEREVLSIEVNEKFPSLSIVTYKVANGYKHHHMREDGIGKMTIATFQSWAREKMDTVNVQRVGSVTLICACGEYLEATYLMEDQQGGADRIECTCGKTWIIPQPTVIEAHNERGINIDRISL